MTEKRLNTGFRESARQYPPSHELYSEHDRFIVLHSGRDDQGDVIKGTIPLTLTEARQARDRLHAIGVQMAYIVKAVE